MSTENTNSKKQNWAIPFLTGMFIFTMIVMIFNGGMCERYEKKMMRRDLQKRYIDSLRHESDLKKFQQQD